MCFNHLGLSSSSSTPGRGAEGTEGAKGANNALEYCHLIAHASRFVKLAVRVTGICTPYGVQCIGMDMPMVLHTVLAAKGCRGGGGGGGGEWGTQGRHVMFSVPSGSDGRLVFGYCM